MACGSPTVGNQSRSGFGSSSSTRNVASDSSGGKRSGGIVAAIASNSRSSRSTSNCAAVNRHDGGAPDGDQAAATAAACSATSRGSVARGAVISAVTSSRTEVGAADLHLAEHLHLERGRGPTSGQFCRCRRQARKLLWQRCQVRGVCGGDRDPQTITRSDGGEGREGRLWHRGQGAGCDGPRRRPRVAYVSTSPVPDTFLRGPVGAVAGNRPTRDPRRACSAAPPAGSDANGAGAGRPRRRRSPARDRCGAIVHERTSRTT